jgi:hypothetical protein
MPYIKQDHRPDYENDLIQLAKLVNSEGTLDMGLHMGVLLSLSSTIKKYYDLDTKLRPGHLNYSITTLFHKVYGSKMRYYDHNEVIGILAQVGLGIKDRATVKYSASGTKQEKLLISILELVMLAYDNNISDTTEGIEVAGMLNCCSMEFYRRSTSTYEDECIEKNGDVTPEGLE